MKRTVKEEEFVREVTREGGLKDKSRKSRERARENQGRAMGEQGRVNREQGEYHGRFRKEEGEYCRRVRGVSRKGNQGKG